MINIKNLNKNYKDVLALKNFTLEIFKGEIFGLVGPNGAGKTTLMKCLTCIILPDCGSIHIAGKQVEPTLTNPEFRIGFAPEDPALYEYLTGTEFLQFTADLRKIAYPQQQILKLITAFQMQEKMDELIDNYSNGMRRKISLIAAILGEPEILLLDEPTNGLDPQSIFEFKKLLKEKSRQGMTVLFSSHILDTVEKLCDRVGIIHQGELAACGTITELTNSRHDLEQRFMEIITTEKC